MKYMYKKETKSEWGELICITIVLFLSIPADAESINANISNNSTDSMKLNNYSMNSDYNTIPQENESLETIIKKEKPKLPESREVVIVYFKEMPPSVEGFASKYGGKPVFVKKEIKMAAFETKPEKRPGVTSQQTMDFIANVSKDQQVEQSFEDGYLFLNPKENYSKQPLIQGPEYYNKLGAAYHPNRVIVGFWRFPPSLEEFAIRYNGKLMNLSEADRFLKVASFETDNISEYIFRISSDPYVQFIELWDMGSPSDIGRLPVSSNNSPGTADTPEASGSGSVSVLLVGILAYMVYMMRNRK